MEHIRSFTTQSHSIDQSLLGDGTFSKTESTRLFPITTGLPSYEVFHKSTGTKINLNTLESDYEDDDDYQDLLFSRETPIDLKLALEDPDTPSPEMAEFVFLDTPGLCNREDKDRAYALNIIDNIVSARSVSLILVVFNNLDPLTAELLLALQYYSHVLRGLDCFPTNIAFVFTPVDYEHSRLSNKALNLELKKRQTL